MLKLDYHEMKYVKNAGMKSTAKENPRKSRHAILAGRFFWQRMKMQ